MYSTAEGFNWQRDADKRIEIKRITMDQVHPSLFSSLEEEVLEKIGREGGMDGYLLQIEVEERDLQEAKRKASQNTSPYIVLCLKTPKREEFLGEGGEELENQNPADYIAEKNIYFNYPALSSLNRSYSSLDPVKESIYWILHTDKTPRPLNLETLLGEYVEDFLGRETLESLFPAYSWMIKRIEDSDSLKLLPFLKSFLKIPYGLPIQTIYLFFALTIYYFKERLWCRVDPKALGERLISHGDFFYELVEGKYPRATIYLRSLSLEEKRHLTFINTIFNGRGEGLLSSYRALSTWWRQDLPLISKSLALYEGETALFVKRMGYLSLLGYSLFLTEDLPAIFSNVEEGLYRVKEELEETPARIYDHLLQGVSKAFPQGLLEWYTSLNSYQLDQELTWQEESTRTLIRAIEEEDGDLQGFIEYILLATRIGPVLDWVRDERERFFQFLTKAKGKIDANSSPIPPPLFEVTAKKGEGTTYYFKNSFILTLRPPMEGVVVLFTDTGEDPREGYGERIIVTSALEYKGDRDSQLKMVSCRDGCYGELVEISMKDLLQKYSISVKEDLFTRSGAGEPEARFTLSLSDEAMERTLRSLFMRYRERGISSARLESLVLEILDSMKEGESED